jgi:hypothetical protein
MPHRQATRNRPEGRPRATRGVKHKNAKRGQMATLNAGCFGDCGPKGEAESRVIPTFWCRSTRRRFTILRFAAASPDIHVRSFGRSDATFSRVGNASGLTRAPRRLTLLRSRSLRPRRILYRQSPTASQATPSRAAPCYAYINMEARCAIGPFGSQSERHYECTNHHDS